MGIYRQHIRQPPSSITGEIRKYLIEVADAFNRMPVFSVFSALTPNSLITGLPGDITVNVGSASTTSRVWIKGGAGNTYDNANWAVIRVLE